MGWVKGTCYQVLVPVSVLYRTTSMKTSLQDPRSESPSRILRQYMTSCFRRHNRKKNSTTMFLCAVDLGFEWFPPDAPDLLPGARIHVEQFDV
jgi:hypothetical protein